MNKLFSVIFALLAVFSLVQCESKIKIFGKLKSKYLNDYVKLGKELINSFLDSFKYQCPGVKDKFRDAIIALDDKVKESLTLCEVVRIHGLNYTQPFLEQIDSCEPEQIRGVIPIAARITISGTDYLCKQNGESIFEIFNPCLWENALIYIDLQDLDPECAAQLTPKLKINLKKKQDYLTKNDFCDLLRIARNCIKTTMTCKNVKTRNVGFGLYDAIAAPCNGVNQA